jgi:hypothetical protein
MKNSIHEKANWQNNIHLAAKRTGFVFAILFSILILLMAAFPLGN